MSAGDLQGRTAIVTGGSRGIGLAAAAALAEAGANVVVTSRQADAAEAAAASIGERAVGFAAHAADETAARACVGHAIERFGSVDVLFNNAGTNPAYGPLVEIERSAFEKTLEVNLWAPLLWTRVCWELCMGERGGAVINNSSMGGLVTGRDLGVYHAAKAALLHLTRHLAVELAPRVRVNAIAPGIVRTRMAEALWREQAREVAAATPLERLGEPPDVAAAVVFLAGDGAGWITGETLSVDGGQRLRNAATDAASGA